MAKKAEKEPLSTEEEILEEIATLSEILGVGGARFEVKFGYEDRDHLGAAAAINLPYPYQTFSIMLFEPFFSMSPARKRQILIHELIHAKSSELMSVASAPFRNEFVTSAILEDSLEAFVDSISLVLADLIGDPA